MAEKFDATKGRSLMYKVNNSKPSEEPWGTLHLIGHGFDLESPILGNEIVIQVTFHQFKNHTKNHNNFVNHSLEIVIYSTKCLNED